MKVKATVKLCPCFYGGWHQTSGHFPAPIHGHLANGPSAQHCGGWIFSNLSPRQTRPAKFLRGKWASCWSCETLDGPKTVERWKTMFPCPAALPTVPITSPSQWGFTKCWGIEEARRQQDEAERSMKIAQRDCCHLSFAYHCCFGFFLILLGAAVARYNFGARLVHLLFAYYSYLPVGGLTSHSDGWKQPTVHLHAPTKLRNGILNDKLGCYHVNMTFWGRTRRVGRVKHWLNINASKITGRICMVDPHLFCFPGGAGSSSGEGEGLAPARCCGGQQPFSVWRYANHLCRASNAGACEETFGTPVKPNI